MSGGVSAGRFVLVDRHLSVRLPHDQAHVVQDVTETELRALQDWVSGQLMQIDSDAVALVARLAALRPAAAVLKPARAPDQSAPVLAGPADTAPPVAAPPLTAAERLEQDIALLRGEGCRIKKLPVREAEYLPRYRLTLPGGGVMEITQADLKIRAAQIRKGWGAPNHD